MLSFSIRTVRSVLCLGAHADDIEIGCGGTLLELFERNPEVAVTWVVLSSGGSREQEARTSAERFLTGVSHTTVEVKDFRNGYFPYQPEIKDYFEKLKGKCSPELLFTHRRNDRHQDHRVVNDLTWNTFRNHLILEYEIPKWDGDFGRPNVYVPLESEVHRRKTNHLMSSFPSQQPRPWYDPDTFDGLMRLRGMECNAESRYAEAFFARKLSLKP
jgi:LmbE family N-acetylglucosaminyl deacetylase